MDVRPLKAGPIEGIRYTAEVQGLKEGWNEIIIKAYDKVQNHNSVSFRIYIERTVKKPSPNQEIPAGPKIQLPSSPLPGGEKSSH